MLRVGTAIADRTRVEARGCALMLAGGASVGMRLNALVTRCVDLVRVLVLVDAGLLILAGPTGAGATTGAIGGAGLLVLLHDFFGATVASQAARVICLSSRLMKVTLSVPRSLRVRLRLLSV